MFLNVVWLADPRYDVPRNTHSQLFVRRFIAWPSLTFEQYNAFTL